MRFEIAWIVAALSVPSRVLSFTTVTRRAPLERNNIINTALYETKSSSGVSLETKSDNLENAWKEAQVTKICKVKVGPTTTSRLGLIATAPINKGEVMLAMPHDDLYVLSPSLARNVVFKQYLPEGYDGWTGDAGLIALLILNQVARADKQGYPATRTKPSLARLYECMGTSLTFTYRNGESTSLFMVRSKIKKFFNPHPPTKFIASWTTLTKTRHGSRNESGPNIATSFQKLFSGMIKRLHAFPKRASSGPWHSRHHEPSLSVGV